MDYTKMTNEACNGMNRGVGTMGRMACNAKYVWTVAGVMAGVALAGTGAYLIWNSRQAKMLRAAKRTGKILRRTGAILQAVADATD